MMSINILILNICGFDFHYSIIGISKSEALNLLQNVDLISKKGISYTIKLKKILPHIKWVKKL